MTPEEIRLQFCLRNRDTIQVLQFFADSSLKEEVRKLIMPITKAAFDLVTALPDGAELVLALQKLRDARYHIINHYVISNNFHTHSIYD